MTVARVILVGEDNPLSDAPEFALYNDPPGCSGWRLQRILGLEDETYLALDRTNLCSPTWKAPAAQARARMLTGQGTPFRVHVLLGSKVRGAYNRALGLHLEAWQHWIENEPICEKPGLAPLTLLALPHPSGRCTEWASEAAKHRARDLLRELAPHVPWGEVK